MTTYGWEATAECIVEVCSIPLTTHDVRSALYCGLLLAKRLENTFLHIIIIIIIIIMTYLLWRCLTGAQQRLTKCA